MEVAVASIKSLSSGRLKVDKYYKVFPIVANFTTGSLGKDLNQNTGQYETKS